MENLEIMEISIAEIAVAAEWLAARNVYRDLIHPKIVEEFRDWDRLVIIHKLLKLRDETKIPPGRKPILWIRSNDSLHSVIVTPGKVQGLAYPRPTTGPGDAEANLIFQAHVEV